ncbi:hypothetical protein [Streptomyces sp. URMC 129]|uniref:hypothetical protein n=1 Tax=Streptomyces sp. URMC 129 TaxID=3423407 RepID=UPI003F1E0A6E
MLARYPTMPGGLLGALTLAPGLTVAAGTPAGAGVGSDHLDKGGGAFVEYQHDGKLVICTATTARCGSSGRAGTVGTRTDINYHGQVWVGDTALDVEPHMNARE